MDYVSFLDNCQCLYICHPGWLAQELNFNEEFQEFVTAFMFLVYTLNANDSTESSKGFPPNTTRQSDKR